MHRFIYYTLLYFIPAVLIGYGLWKNILWLIVGLAWIISSVVLFEIPKAYMEETS